MVLYSTKPSDSLHSTEQNRKKLFSMLMVVAIFINVISVWDRPAKRQQCIRKQTTQEAVGRRVRIWGGAGGADVIGKHPAQVLPDACRCGLFCLAGGTRSRCGTARGEGGRPIPGLPNRSGQLRTGSASKSTSPRCPCPAPHLSQCSHRITLFFNLLRTFPQIFINCWLY